MMLISRIISACAALSITVAPSYASENEPSYYSAIIQLDGDNIDDSLAELENDGVIILHHRADMALAYVPHDRQTSARRAPGVKAIEPGRHWNRPTMDKARLWGDAYKITEGIGIPQPFDGSGVVFGLCDTGFDPSNPNFLTADGSESRVRRIFYYDEDLGTKEIHDNEIAVAAYSTDDPSNYHATHVAGIAAGALDNGYRGMAPGAEIVFCGTRHLTDPTILAGIEDIVAYAKSVGKPAVVNLSIGSYNGPHDGSSLFNRYLDLLGEEAIICLASGNEGAKTNSLSHTFSEAAPEIVTWTADWAGTVCYGQTDIWSADDRSFEYNLRLYHTRTDYIDFPVIDFSQTPVWRVSADADSPYYNEEFAKHYTSGYFEARGAISPLNGRFYVTTEYDCVTEEYDPASANNPGGRWALYWISARVRAEEGVHVDLYADGSYSFLRTPDSKWPAPTTDNSVSDLACGFNTICVGMSNNRNDVLLLNGNLYQDNVSPGAVSGLSSYGTLLDGRVFPHTVAPGYLVVSSANSYFTEENPEMTDWAVASTTHNGRDYYYLSEWGTSMACPFVAGTIATWLQFYPSLTRDDALEAIIATNTTDPLYPDDAHNGYGHFNAYHATEYLLNRLATITPSVLAEAIATAFDGHTLTINNAGATTLTVAVCSLDGTILRQTTVSDTIASLDLSDLPAGIHIVSISTPQGYSRTCKIAVR